MKDLLMLTYLRPIDAPFEQTQREARQMGFGSFIHEGKRYEIDQPGIPESEEAWGKLYYLVEDPQGNPWRRPTEMRLPKEWKALTLPGDPLPIKTWALRRKLD